MNKDYLIQQIKETHSFTAHILPVFTVCSRSHNVIHRHFFWKFQEKRK